MKTLLAKVFFGMFLLVVNISYATAEEKTLHNTDLELDISTAVGYSDSIKALINLMGQRINDQLGHEVTGARIVNPNLADYVRIYVNAGHYQRLALYLNTSNLYIDAVGYNPNEDRDVIFFFNEEHLQNIRFRNVNARYSMLRNTSNYNDLEQVARTQRRQLAINPYSLESNIINLLEQMSHFSYAANDRLSLTRESSRAVISLATIISEALRYPQILGRVYSGMFSQEGYRMSDSDIELTLSWRAYSRAILQRQTYPEQTLTLSDGSATPQYVPGRRSVVGFLLCSASRYKRSVTCDDSPVDEGFGNYVRYGDYLFKKSEIFELTSFIDFYIGKGGHGGHAEL